MPVPPAPQSEIVALGRVQALGRHHAAAGHRNSEGHYHGRGIYTRLTDGRHRPPRLLSEQTVLFASNTWINVPAKRIVCLPQMYQSVSVGVIQ